MIGLWRGAFGVATDRLLGDIEHFGLWESPCGLAFFEPMLPGDETFYQELHRRWDFERRSEEHTSELQSHLNLVCRLLLEKKKKIKTHLTHEKPASQFI